MKLKHDKTVTIAESKDNRAMQCRRWPNRELTVSALFDRLKTPAVDETSFDEYQRLKAASDKKALTAVKDRRGFVGGRVIGGAERNAQTVEWRDTVVIDIDSAETDSYDKLMASWRCLSCCHSTISHTPESPRLRIVLVLSEPITNRRKYEAVARVLAQYIGLSRVDHRSELWEQFMYWGRRLKDGPYEWAFVDAEPLDADALLSYHAEYEGQNWEKPDTLPMIARPLAGGSRETGEGVCVGEDGKIETGSRNNALASLLGAARGSGAESEALKAYAHAINETMFDEPLAETEVDSVVASIMRYSRGAIRAFADFAEDIEGLADESAETAGGEPARAAKLKMEDLKVILKEKGYSINKEGHLCKVAVDDEGEAKQTPIADFVPFTRAVRVYDTGIESESGSKHEIGGRMASGGKLPVVQVDSAKLGAMTWVTPKWASQATIKPPWASNADHVRYVIELTAQMAPVHKYHSSIGWVRLDGASGGSGEWAYIHAKGAVGRAGVRVDLSHAGNSFEKYWLPEIEGGGVSAGGIGREDAIGAVVRSLDLAPRDLTVPKVAFFLMAPLLELMRQAGIDEPGVIDWMSGRTNNGKSTYCIYLMNLFGDFPDTKSAPASFKDTANYLEKAGWVLKDSMLMVDDYMPRSDEGAAKRQKGLAQDLLRAQADRSSRNRMSSDRRTVAGYLARGLCTVTGEEYAEVGESGMARVMGSVLGEQGSLAVGGLVDGGLRFDGLVERHSLRAAMALYVYWLGTQFTEAAYADIRRIFEETRAAYKDLDHKRISTWAAHLVVSASMWDRFAGTQLVTELKEILTRSTQVQEDLISTQKPIEIAVVALVEMLSSDACEVIPFDRIPNNIPNRPFIGYKGKINSDKIDSKTEYLFTQDGWLWGAINRYLKQQGMVLGISKVTFMQHLESKGYVLEGMPIRILGRLVKVKPVNLQKFFGKEVENEGFAEVTPDDLLL